EQQRQPAEPDGDHDRQPYGEGELSADEAADEGLAHPCLLGEFPADAVPVAALTCHLGEHDAGALGWCDLARRPDGRAGCGHGWQCRRRVPIVKRSCFWRAPRQRPQCCFAARTSLSLSSRVCRRETGSSVPSMTTTYPELTRRSPVMSWNRTK